MQSSTESFPSPGSGEELVQFEQLRLRLADQFREFRADVRQPYTAVVVPSQSFDPEELAKIRGIEHYEERSLFQLMLLRRPRLEVVLVTSKRIDPLVIDYYLHQMRGAPSAHARARLHLLDCDDASPQPLSLKILERPRLLQRIRNFIHDPDRAHLSVFNTTPLERTLAVRLGVPLNGCDPRLSDHGSKTGSRRLFREAGVQCVPGHDGLRDRHDLVRALQDLSREAPEYPQYVVKLENSFSGEGNARLDLWPDEVVDESSLGRLVPEAEGLEADRFLDQFDRMGGICEQWVVGAGKTSPSVQMRVNPLGEVQVVSTHDQVLGGKSGQVFLAATFPAAVEHRSALVERALRVGDAAASRGIVGRFGIDFLALSGQHGNAPRYYGLEINLRQGGTTHPFNTLKFLTGGDLDERTGEFATAQGQRRCYYATDNLGSPRYRGMLPVDLIDAMVVEGVHFRSDDTGVVFHLLGCLSQFGKLGAVAIAPSVPEAQTMFHATVQRIDQFVAAMVPYHVRGAAR